MKIEVLKTNKKLTASMIKQMPFICPENFEKINFLGGLRNVRYKESYVILCQNDETKEYFLMNTRYYVIEQRDTTVRFNTLPVLTFENKQKRDEWYNEYESIIKSVKQIFI